MAKRIFLFFALGIVTFLVTPVLVNAATPTKCCYLPENESCLNGRESTDSRSGGSGLVNLSDLSPCLIDGAVVETVQSVSLGGVNSFETTHCYVTNDVCVAKSKIVSEDDEPLGIKLNVTIPLSSFGAGSDIKIDGTTLSRYFSALYRYAVSITGFILVATFMWAGFRRVTAAGQSTIVNQANNLMMGSVVGAVLLFGSYTLLYIVNPKLVQVRDLSDGLSVVTKEEAFDGLDGGGMRAGYAAATGLIDCAKIMERHEEGVIDMTKITTDNRGVGVNLCARWVRYTLGDVFGKQEVTSGDAWQIASNANTLGIFEKIESVEQFRRDVRDGDLVFMYGFNTGHPVTSLDNNGTVSLVTGDDKHANTRLGLPPVSHIGIYYEGRIYHLLQSVENQSVSGSGLYYAIKDWHDGLTLKGVFLRRSTNDEFIAGISRLLPYDDRSGNTCQEVVERVNN